MKWQGGGTSAHKPQETDGMLPHKAATRFFANPLCMPNKERIQFPLFTRMQYQ